MEKSKGVSRTFVFGSVSAIIIVIIIAGFVGYELKPATLTPTPSTTPNPTTHPTTTLTSSPTPIPNTNGTIQFNIKDNNGNSIGDVSVTSIEQPNEINSIVGVTNSTGYITFQNIPIGTYTFRISKNDYIQMDEVINFKGQPIALSITLQTSINSYWAQSQWTISMNIGDFIKYKDRFTDFRVDLNRTYNSRSEAVNEFRKN